MNEKRKKFCDEYLIDLNATQAAIRAGYSERTANRIASQLLSKLDIQNYISEAQQKLQEKTGITQERVLSEFEKIAFANIKEAYTVDGGLKNIKDLPDQIAGAIVGIETYDEKVEEMVIGTTKKVKFADKIAALNSLARHLGMFEKDNKQKAIDLTKAKIVFK